MKKYFFLTFSLLLIALGLYTGYLIFSPKPKAKETVSSQSIVSMLKREGFLVTQTYIVNQQVKINNNTGKIFRDFFLGQEINAFGTMKVSTGVDLNKLTENDLIVESLVVKINLPGVEVQSAELLGDITLQNRQGILKRIIDNDDGYNAAYAALRTQAIGSATTSTLMVEARENTRKEIERLVKFAAPNREVVVNFK